MIIGLLLNPERLKVRAEKRQKRKAKDTLDIKIQQKPASAEFVCQTCCRRANQELAPATTPEPIHNNTDIIEIDEYITTAKYRHGRDRLPTK